MQSLPEKFKARIEKDEKFKGSLLLALNTDAPVSVRLHPHKRAPFTEISSKVDWCANGIYLHERPKFTLDPLFHAGTYYPQEAGSMYLLAVAQSLELPEEPCVLDLCAAPGGKSTLLADFLNNKGVLLSNEVIRMRSQILAENITKWGYSNCLVCNNDPREIGKWSNTFDFVVVDAPCSGEGMFRKDPAARDEWSEENVHLCSLRQRRILADSWDCVKEDGYVFYSTCTFNPDENELNVDWMRQELGAEIMPLPYFDGMIKDNLGYGYYFSPGKTQSEGFYAALLRKRSPSETRKIKSKPFSTISSSSAAAFIDEKIPHTFFQIQENEMALTPFAFQKLNEWEGLHFVKRGTLVGTATKKGFVPDAELAFNFSLRNENESLELSQKEALQFLHGDTFTLESNPGIHAVSFQKEVLGYIKHLGNRFNNLYPKEWRIRMNIQ